MSIHRQPLNIVALCSVALQHIQVSAGTEHQFDFEYDPRLPMVSVDEGLMGRVVRRLFSNAVKYSQPGTTIRTKLVCDQGKLCIIIQDQGIGIRPEDTHRIFEPFFRGSNISETPGIGLGLRISRDIVEMHGGELTFISQPGIGTTFTLSLPVN